MNSWKKNILLGSVAGVLIILGLSPLVLSHCQIPCGIYDDPMRFQMMAEHMQTIEKSMNQINQLSAEAGKNSNQLVRWVDNKEHHADYLSEIVTQYFMAQRIKPVDADAGQAYQDYITKLTLLHKMMVYSMKCKQTTDLDNVKKLRECLDQFSSAYMGKAETAEAAHGREHRR